MGVPPSNFGPTCNGRCRWRLNHPTAIRRRYDAAHRVPDDVPGTSPATGYKARLAQAIMERDEARQQLKGVEIDGSLFSLEMNTGAQIGRITLHDVCVACVWVCGFGQVALNQFHSSSSEA
jgi:hypothetical protein